MPVDATESIKDVEWHLSAKAYKWDGCSFYPDHLKEHAPKSRNFRPNIPASPDFLADIFLPRTRFPIEALLPGWNTGCIGLLLKCMMKKILSSSPSLIVNTNWRSVNFWTCLETDNGCRFKSVNVTTSPTAVDAQKVLSQSMLRMRALAIIIGYRTFLPSTASLRWKLLGHYRTMTFGDSAWGRSTILYIVYGIFYRQFNSTTPSNSRKCVWCQRVVKDWSTKKILHQADTLATQC